MTNKPRYTLLISGCDAYLDVLPPLFILFRKYWPGLNAPIVLNTETQPYRHEGFEILCPQLCKEHSNPKDVPWSRRLRETLTRAVSSDLVLLFLDDFYLRSPVNERRLAACVEWMQANPNTACIYLYGGVLSEDGTAKCSPWLAIRPKPESYLRLSSYFSLLPGLWRRDRLLHFLRDYESPWLFERWGSIRARRYPDDLYDLAAVAGVSTVFDHWPSQEGLSKGKWLPKTPEYFQKEGIALDLSFVV